MTEAARFRYVNAHSHTFQRALRSEGGDFWAWRDSMLDAGVRADAETVREEYEATYREMLAAGYSTVGEFHYLGLDAARAAAEAAARPGSSSSCSSRRTRAAAWPSCARNRLRSTSRRSNSSQAEGIRVGLAPHSVRACPRDWLEQIGRYARENDLVLHVHADEQPREIEECLAEHEMRPIELLHETGCLGPRTTVIHATHADDHELDLLRDTGSRICICPTTEADLGDGFARTLAIRERAIAICIGSDANVSIDPRDELRELEWIARRQALRRGVFSPGDLERIGADEGATSLGL